LHRQAVVSRMGVRDDKVANSCLLSGANYGKQRQLGRSLRYKAKPVRTRVGGQGSGGSDLASDAAPLSPRLSCETNPICIAPKLSLRSLQKRSYVVSRRLIGSAKQSQFFDCGLRILDCGLCKTNPISRAGVREGPGAAGSHRTGPQGHNV
jgi:hypothetical protein